MKKTEVKRFDSLYSRHLKLLKIQGKSDSTIDAYSRAVRRVRVHFDRLPEKLTKDDLQNYFSDLVESHSWSTVKVDRLGVSVLLEVCSEKRMAMEDRYSKTSQGQIYSRHSYSN